MWDGKAAPESSNISSAYWQAVESGSASSRRLSPILGQKF